LVKINFEASKGWRFALAPIFWATAEAVSSEACTPGEGVDDTAEGDMMDGLVSAG
jgi:hypothetical protein